MAHEARVTWMASKARMAARMTSESRMAASHVGAGIPFEAAMSSRSTGPACSGDRTRGCNHEDQPKGGNRNRREVLQRE